MIDINEKFRRMAERKQQAAVAEKRKLARQMADARLIESFMNIHQIERTGLCQDFVESFYAKKRQELGDSVVDELKCKAAEYINILKSSGDIYMKISWFRFVLDRISR